MMRVGKRDFDDLRPCALQPCDAFGPELVDLARHAVDAIFLRDADPHALEVAGERRFIIGNGKIERGGILRRSEEHTSELQSLMRISYAVFCLKKKKYTQIAYIRKHISR